MLFGRDARRRKVNVDPGLELAEASNGPGIL